MNQKQGLYLTFDNRHDLDMAESRKVIDACARADIISMAENSHISKKNKNKRGGAIKSTPPAKKTV